MLKIDKICKPVVNVLRAIGSYKKERGCARILKRPLSVKPTFGVVLYCKLQLAPILHHFTLLFSSVGVVHVLQGKRLVLKEVDSRQDYEL